MESRQRISKKPIARRVRFEGGNQATTEQENHATTDQAGQPGSSKVGVGPQQENPTRAANKLEVREDSIA